ncbi:hypothetical protein [Costertonia aggregata]|uniref:Uncharacterized protein n=1 Tax=Costertonia aggregata TaxID=343403 RepID=A0A7H9AN84_9FLAO|nr:hypothetical protein [Costertonia aggregata]QLG44911.1 hypothetical protein HYG79_05935 [Costertonia aggregata]
MKNSNLKQRILVEIESLIARSCPNQKISKKFENLHVAILKKYYNATDVSIDYHRKRVEMDIVLDDTSYDPKKVNVSIPTLHVNLLFQNLKEFLKNCIDSDNKSLAFYASLLKSFEKKEVLFKIV